MRIPLSVLRVYARGPAADPRMCRRKVSGGNRPRPRLRLRPRPLLRSDRTVPPRRGIRPGSPFGNSGRGPGGAGCRNTMFWVLRIFHFDFRRRGRLSGDGVRHCVLCPARFRRDAVRDGVRVSADGVRHCVLCSARSRREAVRDGVRVSADGVRHCVLGPARSRRDAVSDGVRIPAYGVPAPHSMQPR